MPRCNINPMQIEVSEGIEIKRMKTVINLFINS